ncbi:hypothetical protein HUW51_07145 [Adhaeribacter swui]|uniref:Uncharacterized protein n=1 Tax=Adhaeribacter swui TaxID=2086471 RepID=A0A7G7G5S7_9BACT|nr:hypothetical protein [Adhaeribacter swui]QNF32511.1 hypothetical protein HUW51_07145 [Adhaeribacter swui]
MQELLNLLSSVAEDLIETAICAGSIWLLKKIKDKLTILKNTIEVRIHLKIVY